MSEGALSDLSILEWAEGEAGPYCGKLFADLGAEVIKLEPRTGDRSRRAGPFPGDVPHPERSGLHLYLNSNKQGITLDLDTAGGRRVLRELVATVDVLITDAAPHRLEELELDYARLAELNERLIMTAITPFGAEGPYRDYAGSALTTFHSSAVGYETPTQAVTDLEAQPPLGPGNAQSYYFAGLTAAADTMAAVFHRAISGRGQFVDVSVQESMANHARIALNTVEHTPDTVPGRLKANFDMLVPTSDGYVYLSPYAFDHWWVAFREMMGDPEWARSELFDHNEGRTLAVDAIEPLVHEWAQGLTRRQIYELSLDAGVPCFPVNSAQDMFASEQLQAREFFVEVDHPEAGRFVQPGPSVRYSRTPARVAERFAPRLGEHNEQVLCGRLGYSREELMLLARAGVC